MATSRNKSNGSSLCMCRNPSPIMPPSSSSSSPSPSPGFASSTSCSFTSRPSTSTSTSTASLFTRATSPTRVNMYNHHHRHSISSSNQYSPSLRFSMDHTTKRQVASNGNAVPSSSQKRTCACSPTMHPGSFRCALHRATMKTANGYGSQRASYHSSSTLNFRRSAMKNSLVRIGGVEGEIVKRALSALIRPSSHQLRRRAAFEPRPSRLSVMSRAEDF